MMAHVQFINYVIFTIMSYSFEIYK